MSDLPTPDLKPAPRSLLERVSIVWVVPLAALVIALGVAWQNYSDRGPVIRIAFENAAGVQAGETELRYRDVAVGIVEEVGFGPDLVTVVATVRVENDVAPYIDEEAEFWVVTPQVTTRGVTGLSTVLSGVYIEGVWDGDPGGLERTFTGLEAPPLTRPGEPGLSLLLVSESGEGLNDGTPILYRGIDVGRISNPRLADDGVSVLADAFIRDPHSNLVTQATRFWDTSGFSLSLGPSGLELDVSSVASLVSGGVAFDTFVTGAELAEDDDVYQLFPSEDEAQNSVFAEGDAVLSVPMAMVFLGDASGLVVGNAVEYRGLQIGEVSSVTGLIDEDAFGDRRVRVLAVAELEPARLGLTGEPTEEAVYELLQEFAENGVRAQLARASLFIGGLKIELAELPDPEPAALVLEAEPYPVFPTVEADLPDAAATAEGVFARINDLPIEELLSSAIAVLDNVNRVIADPAVQEIPEEVMAILGDVRAITGSEAVQDLPEQTQELMAALGEAAAELRATVAAFQEAGGGEAVARTVTAAGEAAEAVGRVAASAEPAVEALPELVARLDALAAKAVALPLEDLVAEATAVVATAEAVLSDPALAQIPAGVSGTLDQVRGAVADFRASGAIEGLADAAIATEEAAVATEEAVIGVPELVERLTALADTANALPLDALVGRAADAAEAAAAILSQETTRALPGDVQAALAELQAALADIRESGVIAGASETLASADRAADAVATSVEGVPALVERLDTLAATANALPLEALVTEGTELVNAAQTLIGTPAAQAVPEQLNAALSELATALRELREGGVVENANATLASARDAADAVAAAAGNLPALVERFDALAGQAEATLATYGEDSQLSYEVRAALQEIRDAARSLSSLARAIERNPNSLLLGR